METTNIIILDYSTGTVYMGKIPTNLISEFDVLDYVGEELNIKLRGSECSWMTVGDLNIKVF